MLFTFFVEKKPRIMAGNDANGFQIKYCTNDRLFFVTFSIAATNSSSASGG